MRSFQRDFNIKNGAARIVGEILWPRGLPAGGLQLEIPHFDSAQEPQFPPGDPGRHLHTGFLPATYCTHLPNEGLYMDFRVCMQQNGHHDMGWPQDMNNHTDVVDLLGGMIN
ncbi:unnamed protein product [Calypogeia fissa]